MPAIVATRAPDPERGRPVGWLAALACLAFAACSPTDPAGTSAGPVALMPPAPAVANPTDAAAERALVNFYATVEEDLRASGRMRLDTAPADMPYGVSDLVRDFKRVALFDEYRQVHGEFQHTETPAFLRKWNQPVRVAVMTSGLESPEDAARDRANVAAFSRRLARLTGVDMKVGEDGKVNFLVLFMDSNEREAFASAVSARYPGFAPSVMHALHDTPLDTFCVTYGFAEPDNPGLYSAVIVLIRAEHPAFTRLSCVHEEMAQAMGLPNDSPDSRPSLFNDNLEFALLTEHDEILLRMLYDPRLRPGMTATEANPLLPQIARDAIAAERRAGGAATVAAN